MGRGQIEIYVDRAGYWRWRFRARNGRITAVSSESYDRRGGAEKSARSTVGRLTRIIEVEWHDEMRSLDPIDEARRSLDRATRNTDRAEKRAAQAQETIDEIKGLTGLDE